MGVSPLNVEIQRSISNNILDMFPIIGQQHIIDLQKCVSCHRKYKIICNMNLECHLKVIFAPGYIIAPMNHKISFPSRLDY